MTYTFSSEDKNQLKEKGISEQTIDEQLNYYKNGFPTLNIKKHASVNEGILQVNEQDQLKYISIWEEYLKSDNHVTKFVPASGAASRMFKDLYGFLESNSDEPTTDFEKEFFKNIRSFAFYDALNETCMKIHGMSVDDLVSQKEYKKIVHALLSENGLNYGELPKGLLLFHSYHDKKRTPMEEHLVEGAMYAKDDNNNVNVHFTISPHHEKLFVELLDEIRDELQKTSNASFNVTFSIQKPSTDTIAVDLENRPFIDEGVLLFRPGGHGALIENLNDLQSDIVFVKNIDNIVPDKYKENDAKYKKMLGGILIATQNKVFEYLDTLKTESYIQEDLDEIKDFVVNTLCITTNLMKDFDIDELLQFLIEKLDRPIRVCGMVKNEGEPGGGPFIVENSDGTFSPHILEGSQIVTDSAAEIASHSTHFNPVDLVCSIKNHQRYKFNLLNFVDKDTGFISSKSKSGRELKALELPGLWNGAMSDWNTIFVELPISTFNPVKTVNDLLRDEHQ